MPHWLPGVDQLLLALAITIYPETTEDEIATFTYKKGGGLYPNSTISRRLKELNISKNVVSTEAYHTVTSLCFGRVHHLLVRKQSQDGHLLTWMKLGSSEMVVIAREAGQSNSSKSGRLGITPKFIN